MPSLFAEVFTVTPSLATTASILEAWVLLFKTVPSYWEECARIINFIYLEGIDSLNGVAWGLGNVRFTLASSNKVKKKYNQLARLDQG